MKSNLMPAVEFIRAHDSFLLICHDNPDGDTLGSALGLSFALKQLGKDSRVICGDPVPQKYLQIPGAKTVCLAKDCTPAPLEAVICIDCSSKEMLEKSAHCLHEPSLCIDHHSSNNGYTDVLCCNPKAAATGEYICELFSYLNISITPEIATCILYALSSDTGNFSQINTTAKTLRFAADMMEQGANLAKIYQEIFFCRSLPATRLIGVAISHLELFADGKGALMTLSLEDLKRIGADNAEVEGIINYARAITGVVVCAMLREKEDGSTKVSIRSDGTINVCAIAEGFGGGGHFAASGATLCTPLEDAVITIKEALKKAIWTES